MRPHRDNSDSDRPVALVTGASSGIGRAIAQQLATAGYAVVISARRGELLEQVAEQLRADGGSVTASPCDAQSPDATHALVQSARAAHGRLDLVVANAGAYLRKSATETTRADIESMLDANFWSTFELIQAALPSVRERRGQLVLINSFDAKKGLPHDAAYAAAKAALAGFATSLRQSLRGDGVHVCTVFPGRVDTDMIRDLEVPAISAKIPAERVARAVLRAIRRRKAEVIVPWHIRMLHWADVLSPRLGDWLVRRLRIDGKQPS